MSNRTLLFENIAGSSSVFNMNTVANTPRRPRNAVAPRRNAKMQVGRYGQTKGNPINADIYPNTPICPYHMPRNPNRYKESRLTMNQKRAGDTIEARDINNLIDKIKLFGYAWEAEAENIYNYQGVTGSNRLAVNMANMVKIISEGNTDLDGYEIKDPKKLGVGSVDILMHKPIQIFTASGANENEVKMKLIAAMNTRQRTGINLSNPLPHGFPEYLDDIVVGTQTVENKYEILHGGFAPLVGVQAVTKTRPGVNKIVYNLKYLSGNKEGEYVKDKNNIDLKFNSYEPYIFSYRQDNQPDTLLSYAGFVLYHLDFVIDNTNLTVQRETKTYVPGVLQIVTRNETDFSWVKTIPTTAVNTTDSYLLDTSKIIPYIPVASLFWEDIDSRTEFLTWYNSLTNKTIRMPKQRVLNSNFEYLNNTTWENHEGIYWISLIKPAMKEWEKITTVPPPSGSPAGTPPTTVVTKYKQYGFSLTTELHNPITGEFKTNIDINNSTFKQLADGSWEFNSKIFGTEKDCMDLMRSNNNFQDIGGGEFIITPKGSIVGYDDDATGGYVYYKDNGVVTDATYYRYDLDVSCPPGSTIDGGRCLITTIEDTSFIGGIKSETPEYVIITEYDLTYKTLSESPGQGKYPLIKATDYRNIKNVLYRYLERILNIARTGINNGNSDPITANEIDTFFTTQESWGTPIDLNNPDTSFLGYHAYTGGIIKVEFYNALLEAYKIIINSCLCNADCSCNVNCICNVNCGCNY